MEAKEAETWTVWVNWERRVLSFHPVPGFHKWEFLTHADRMEFALQKCREGFAIQ